MADEPQQDEEQPKDDAQPEEAAPSEEQAPEADASATESEEQAPDADAPAAQSADSAEGGEEPEESGDGDDAAELAEDAATEAPEQPEEEDSGGEASSKEPAKASKDLPPGADLDPIALEPEKELSAEEKARLEAEATAEVPAEQASDEPRTLAQLAGDARYIATGKRKRSIARVIITPGDGKFEINRRTLQEYFPRPLHQSTALQPLSVSGYEGTVDVRVNVQGGGIGGQAGAIRHGIARALTEIDPELRKELKKRGFLTRDARVKERRKAGLKKARKRPQFSKR